jgi:hypothetical protein
MANSLKATFPALSRIIGYTPAALYARQRTFVDAGILESTPGRGPGSGVRASPETLAEFLIGIVTHATLDENVPFAKGIARATPGGKCPLTGATTFKKALAAILSDKALLDRVSSIRIGTNTGLTDIKYDGYDGSLSTFFSKAINFPETGVMFQVVIMPETLRKLADVLKEVDQ